MSSSNALNSLNKFRMVLLRRKLFPIHEMLKIEESIMRCDTRRENVYVLLNEGTPDKSIVMGASGDVEKLVFSEHTKADNIPIVKRFSGGGTVLVDHRTMFVSIVGSHKFLKHMSFDPTLSSKIAERENIKEQQYKAYPEDIMAWSAGFYSPIFPKTLNFQLRENDYIFYGDKKFGGNAQYITGGKLQRWVHHTSFLWDMDETLMEKYLKLPEKKPQYRSARSHTDFLVTLKNSLGKESPEITEPGHFLDLVHGRVKGLCENEWKENVEEVIELNSFDDVKHFVNENTFVRTTVLDQY